MFALVFIYVVLCYVERGVNSFESDGLMSLRCV